MKTIATAILSVLCAVAIAQSDDHTDAIANMKARCTSAMDKGVCSVALDPANYTDPRGYPIQRPYGQSRWIPNEMVVGLSQLRFAKDDDGGYSMCNRVDDCATDWEGDMCVLIKSKWRQTPLPVPPASPAP